RQRAGHERHHGGRQHQPRHAGRALEGPDRSGLEAAGPAGRRQSINFLHRKIMNKNNGDKPGSRSALLRDPNFTWLMSGGVISALGDQFTMIALPWLVLQLTRDPLALGMMVALLGVPRDVLILFGGALVDRHSAKRILMLTKHVNTVLLGLL